MSIHKTPDPKLIAAIAADVIAHEEAQNRHYDIQPQMPEPDTELDDVINDAFATDIFPPDMFGVQSSQHVMQRLMRTWDHYKNKPRRLKKKLAIDERGHPYRDPTEEEAKERKLAQDLAHIIDVPRVTADTVLRLAYDDNAALSRGLLAKKIDVIFGLNGALEDYLVAPNPENKNIIDMPFKMDANRYYDAAQRKMRTPDHSQLLLDIFRVHGTNASEFSQHVKMHGLNASVIQHVAAWHQDPDAFDPRKKEPVLGESIGKHLDMLVYGKSKDGPFMRYYNLVKKQAIFAYQGHKTDDWSYLEKYPVGEKAPLRSARQISLEKTRTRFYQKLGALTELQITSPLDLSQHYDMRIGVAMGWLKPNRKEKNIIADHPELQEAGIDKMSGILAEKKYTSPEYRQDYYTLTDIAKDYRFANQDKASWKSFRQSAAGFITNVHDVIRKQRRINADTALVQVSYPITGYDVSVPLNDKNGGETLYLTRAFVDSMISHGALVAKDTQPKPV